jgi:hypothetical protein
MICRRMLSVLPLIGTPNEDELRLDGKWQELGPLAGHIGGLKGHVKCET